MDWNEKGKLMTFDQHEFLPSCDEEALRKSGIGEHGYLYVPDVCFSKSCHLHIVLHGASQYAGKLGRTFPTQTGYLEYAASNDLVLLFPQAAPVVKVNPKGAWDFWGYTDRQLFCTN